MTPNNQQISGLTILPSESLLLGLCVGEYESTGHVNFMATLRQRLIPFQNRPRITTHDEPVPESDIPSDVEWKSFKGIDGYQKGWSASDPNAMYSSHHPDHYVRIRIDIPAERVFVRQLVDELSPDIAFTLLDVVEGITSSEEMPFGRAYWIAFDDPSVAGWEYLRSNSPWMDEDELSEELARVSQTERPEQLLERIGSIIEANQLKSTFQIGQEFGRLLAHLESWLEYMEDPERERMFKLDERWRAYLDYCHKRGEVGYISGLRLGFNSEFHEEKGKPVIEAINELLQTAKELWKPAPFLEATLHSLKETRFWEHREWIRIQTSTTMSLYWFAFGQVMLAVKSDDELSRETNAARTTPMSLQVFESGSPDAIRAELREAEYLLEYRQSDAATKQVLRGTTQLVEALCKRMWPEEFPARARVNVGSVLRRKCKETERDDKRFASIAMTVHFNYRNPASHDQNFQATRREAKFVLNALYAMLDLFESKHR